MSTCRCCGQHIEAAGQTSYTSGIVRVDDGVLSVCNAAFELARTRGHARVEAAHAVLAIAMSDAGAALLSRHGLGAQQVGRAADAWLASWVQTRREGEALATSADLKQVLRDAERQAQRAGRSHAALDDVVAALNAHASTFWPASFWPSPAAQSTLPRAGTAQDLGPAPSQGGASERVFSASAVAAAAAKKVEEVQPSLLDREYAWVRDLSRTKLSAHQALASETATTQAAMGSASASAAGSASVATSITAAAGARTTPTSINRHVPLETTTRLRGERDRDAGAVRSGARVTRLFAPVPAASAPVAVASTPAPKNDDALMRSILQRLDSQERALAQRLDTQQRMLADLAEAFARTMRDLSQARADAAAALQSRHAVQAHGAARETDNGGAAGTSSVRVSSRTGNGQRRARRGRWRRQSWSAWRSGQRRLHSKRASGGDGLLRDQEDLRQLLPLQAADAAPQSANIQPVVELTAEAEPDEPNEREKRFYLTLDDEIEKAPSIGPRTASQLNAAGIITVRDLLTCDPAVIAARVPGRFVTAERMTQWQAQSRLVCTIPWLRGTHAQLLAGAGFDTIEKIAAADVPGVCAAILKFAATRDGQSVLRSAPPPGEDWVVKRLQHARVAEPERAIA